MQTYYVLSGNIVLGHFDTLCDCWTRELAVEMAGIDTTQEGLERLYMEGADCVYHDEESDCYVFDANECRILDFEPNRSILKLCERIRNSREWDPVDTCILCGLAGLNDEWINASAEDFEQVVIAAAEKMGGMVL